MSNEILTDYQIGFIKSLELYAHWHNGEQQVGSWGKTLAEAKAEFLAESKTTGGMGEYSSAKVEL